MCCCCLKWRITWPSFDVDLFTGIAAGSLLSCLILLNERWERWARFTLGHLAVSFKCTIFLHLFIASKTSLNLGHVCVCVRKRDRFESSPDAPEGICWVPIEGDYRQMELSGRLELLKDFVKLGQWADSFPSKAPSFLFSSCIWLCRQNMAHLLILLFLNQNQKVIKNWKLMWETFILILKPGTRFWEWWWEHIFNFSVHSGGMFFGQMSFPSSWEKTHLLVLLWQGPALWSGYTFASEINHYLSDELHSKNLWWTWVLRLKKHVVCFKE